MATTVNDFKEMELTELCQLYLTICRSRCHSKFTSGAKLHDNPTLDIMRDIIEYKVDGTLFNEYQQLVKELGEGDFESANSRTIVKSEYFYFNRIKDKLGFKSEVKHNGKLHFENKTVDWAEEQETADEAKANAQYDVVEERREELWNLQSQGKLTQTDMAELRQIESLKR